MKISLENNQLIIEEASFIPVDNSEFGKKRAAKDCDKMPDIQSLVSIARENGYDLPSQSFIHCFESWALDLKSNYHHNGINVFTPCGCNPLRFTIYKGDGKTYFA